jgi:ribosomal protein L29
MSEIDELKSEIAELKDNLMRTKMQIIAVKDYAKEKSLKINRRLSTIEKSLNIKNVKKY